MQRVIEYLFRSILCVVLLLTGWALLRIFVCDQFVVPSESMSPTLIAGDRILANKLVAGARIYKKIEFGKDIPLRFITIATQHRSETSISSDASTVPPTR